MDGAPSFDDVLSKLFDAEREARSVHDMLTARGHTGESTALIAALRLATRASEELDEAESSMRQVCIARLLGEFDGDDAVDALVDVLASAHAEARHEAGEQLQGLAFERFKEVALGVERALGRLEVGSPALVELPYVLIDVPEPGIVKLLGKFLKHGDPDAVAAAIETLAEIGDVGAVELLEPLAEDARVTRIDEGDDSMEVTVGELAREAIELLSRSDGE